MCIPTLSQNCIVIVLTTTFINKNMASFQGGNPILLLLRCYKTHNNLMFKARQNKKNLMFKSSTYIELKTCTNDIYTFYSFDLSLGAIKKKIIMTCY